MFISGFNNLVSGTLIVLFFYLSRVYKISNSLYFIVTCILFLAIPLVLVLNMENLASKFAFWGVIFLCVPVFRKFREIAFSKD